MSELQRGDTCSFIHFNLLHPNCISMSVLNSFVCASLVSALSACQSVRSRGDFTVEKLPPGFGCTQGPFVWHQCSLLLWVFSSSPGRKQSDTICCTVMITYFSFQQHVIVYELRPLALICKAMAMKIYFNKKWTSSVMYCAIWWTYWKPTVLQFSTLTLLFYYSVEQTWLISCSFGWETGDLITNDFHITWTILSFG